MSDNEHINPNTGRHVGVSGGIQVVTAQEAALDAGKPRQPDERDAVLADLRDHINKVILAGNLLPHAKAQAQAKAQELVFWINAGLARPPE